MGYPAHVVLGEGFADVSFRVGGRRGWQAIAVAVLFPIVIGLPVYGMAWMTGLASFAPRPGGVATQFASTSPVAAFVVMLAVAATTRRRRCDWRGKHGGSASIPWTNPLRP